MQHTVSNDIKITGHGLHSGKPASIIIKPVTDVDHGVVFKRTDIKSDNNEIPALYHNVVNTTLCTVIGNTDRSATVATIEHLMAALRAIGVDNAMIEIDGPEVPILDGSSVIFYDKIAAVGLIEQSAARRAIRIKKTVKYQDGDSWVTLSPSVEPTYKARIDYAHPSIGEQAAKLTLVNGDFRHDFADCRTFCLLSDVEVMQANNRALGGSLENAVVLDDNGIMNSEGLRCAKEFARHKVLDAVGDLALSGGFILGAYEGHKAGHTLNYELLKVLFNDSNNYEIVDHYVNLESSDEIVRTMGTYTAPVKAPIFDQ